MRLQDLNQYSLQEIYNKVAGHLVMQNKQSIANKGSEYPMCKYKSGQLKCAVGILIADEDYNPEMEGQGVHNLIAECKPFRDVKIDEERIRMLSFLQHVHDSYAVEDWVTRLDAIANKFNLNKNVINEY